MLKMLLDANGGIVLTNDGHAILREIDVSHPAAKVRCANGKGPPFGIHATRSDMLPPSQVTACPSWPGHADAYLVILHTLARLCVLMCRA